MTEDWSSGWSDAEHHILLLGASLSPSARFELLQQMQEFACNAGAFQREIQARLLASDQLWENNSEPPEKRSA
ncbi:MAG TPA: hypothetical protein VHL58_08345 [Thermoanaerobaculia bacterium]|nr:hypothetical protein [Thermoanaerobaculia bacterium]